MCVRTINVRGYEVGCGCCYECQMQRRSEWSFRMQVETKYHPNAYFLTLTYNDENLDNIDVCTKLSIANRKHIQNFIRELRRVYELKYFGVHEYGSQTFRKHYHIIIWLLDDTAKLDLSLIQRLWTFGFIDKSQLNNARIHYVTKYLNKPFRKYSTNVGDILNSDMTEYEREQELLNNFLRENTFNFMSTRPAIGQELLDDVEICNYIIETTLETGEYPKLTINNQSYSIPRYYLKKLFSDEERQSIYFNNKEKRMQDELNKIRKLNMSVEEYARHRQRKDELNLDRVLIPSIYETI